MQELIRFQTERGLDKNEYKAINEHVNILEEMLESMGLDVPKEKRPVLKEVWNEFVNKLVTYGITTGDWTEPIPVEEQVDAYCDVITFATGAILKLGYDPIKAISECGREINSRVGSMVDGKFEKDLSPEAQANWYKADYSKAVKDGK